MSKSKLKDLPHNANLPLQILMYVNVYLSAAWSALYGWHLVQNISYVTTFHGKFMVVAFVMSACSDCFRLCKGYSGNLKSNTDDLSLFLVLSLIVQLPLFVFLWLSAQTYFLLISIFFIMLLLLVLFEFLIGIYCWQQQSFRYTHGLHYMSESPMYTLN